MMIEDSPPTAENETAAGTTAGAGGAETEFIPDAVRNMDTPAAWSDADDDVVDYPPTGAEALERLPNTQEVQHLLRPLTFSWFTAISAAILVVVAAATVVVWTYLAHRTDPKPHPPPLPSSVAASPEATQAVPSNQSPVVAPSPPPRKSPEELIDEALTETIDGKTVLAFEPINLAAGGYGTPEKPSIEIDGGASEDQPAGAKGLVIWTDVQNKLAALGIKADTDNGGFITAVSYFNDDARNAWRAWYGSRMPTAADDASYLSELQEAEEGSWRFNLPVWGIGYAHEVCRELKFGKSAADVMDKLWRNTPDAAMAPGRVTPTPHQAYVIVGITINTYCPQFKGQL